MLAALVLGARGIASLILDYYWWSELGQVETWLQMWLYRWAPGVLQWLILFALVWLAHARGLKYAGTGLRHHPGYARLTTLAAALVALFLTAAAVDGWVVARYFGGQGVTADWRDPVFDRPLSFYFFELPFYSRLAGFLAVCAAAAALVYYATARLWQLRLRFPELWQRGQLEWEDFKQLGRLEATFLKAMLALLLAGLAVMFWLGRYALLYSDHGELLTGLDYVQQNVGLPLQTAKAVAALLAAVLLLTGRRALAGACALVLVADIVAPPLVASLYVRPNELALERPYIERHIEATRSAYGLSRRVREIEFPARKNAPINFEANRALIENVRLWDWQAFHDTLSQAQPLRPYAYADTDIDRYEIGGRTRQVLLAPRELDLNQLGAAQQRWVIAHTIYTHGYGLVMAEANGVTETGSPRLLIRDAPLTVQVPGLHVTRPEIYYGEQPRDPVFVRTTQPEFNYPSGSEDVSTRYDGRGGFPTPLPVRLVAAVATGDWNIMLSDALSAESRMMLRRGVVPRLSTLAPFIEWDSDPYLVVAGDGRLVWIVDGYTTSNRHPYSRPLSAPGLEFNYIRNAVKATVDAYHGDVHLYIFDEEDPLIQAYARLFPALFAPAAEMPADLRRHARAPEFLFRAQAEIYRTYHMRAPESFYNRADTWDWATFTGGQGSTPKPFEPTYLMATLPGEPGPEFLLTIPFTPRNKQNLIGLMAARCDGEHLGELVFLLLPKQEIIPGPLQIEALINQDAVISKDLSLWNQQGSQVLRGQIQVLPVDNTFLYVAPIYIQAAQARMPQMEKIVLAAGDNLIYADNYRQAVEMLAARQQGGDTRGSTPGLSEPQTAIPSSSRSPAMDPRILEIRRRLERYRALTAEGRLSDAGKELEAVESLVK
jgi:uncharacterized membrane protein (UPF0182 family)